ncbi:uncharacterized protein LOC133737678 [Rosa rugosa]|uniref:uncharacterized protein LOC133737678 n=1 Tax=Rosa rugosa TaxID=74645 RepID=UPI002B4178D3|nr:uncharacterized protein LOC133737678 [Rosa rugosa]
MNFDGYVRNGNATIGFVIRNADDNPLFAANRMIGNANVLVAEATALRDGLQTALLHHYSNIVVEGDSKLLIDCIQGSYEVPWRIRLMIQDIKQLAQQFEVIIFRHIYREANFVTDHLTTLAHNS